MEMGKLQAAASRRFSVVSLTVLLFLVGLVLLGSRPRVALALKVGPTEAAGLSVSASGQPLTMAEAGLISIGSTHGCGIRPDLSVDCWGENYQGMATDQKGPFIQVEAGNVHTCALRPDGTVYCFGDNRLGELNVPPGLYQQISTTGSQNCGLKMDGTAVCWGGYSNPLVPPVGIFTQISVGTNACGLRPNGAIECWGRAPLSPPIGTFTQVSAGADYFCALQGDGTAVCWGSMGDAPPGTYTQISVGDNHACAIRTDGSITCWGKFNWAGQLNAPAGRFSHISVSSFTNCALRLDGTAVCWGYDTKGQASPPGGAFGTGWLEIVQEAEPADAPDRFDFTTTSLLEPSFSLSHGMVRRLYLTAGSYTVAQNAAAGYLLRDIRCSGGSAAVDLKARQVTLSVTTSDVVSCTFITHKIVRGEEANTVIASGGAHSCAIRPDKSVACWGRNDFGQASAPAGAYQEVSAGYTHTCALKADESVVCWGRNNLGQTTAPAGSYTQVSAGYDHTCALRDDGSLACWGDNRNQQTNAPAGAFVAVNSGWNHACGIRVDGSVTCWGSNAYGQTNVPAGIYLQVTAGAGHTCALKNDRSLRCWGLNTYGQATTPAGTFQQIIAGGLLNCARKMDGGFLCWGRNDFGQSSSPTGIYQEVGAGHYHNCGLRDDGSLACWGSNNWGQINAPAGPFGPAGRIEIIQLDESTAQANVFSFTTNSPTTPTFALRHGENQMLHVGIGRYTIKQLPLHGLLLRDVRCEGGVTQYDTATESVTIDLVEGATVRCSFTNIPLPPDVVSAGIGHNCALRPDRSITCWGSNQFGQANAPTGAFTQVVAGDYHSCALRADQSVTCWGGWDVWGPTNNVPAGTFKQVSAGRNHSCAVKTDNTIVCWGSNDAGQLNVPAGNYVQVSVGQGYSCAIRSNLSAVCWGYGGDLAPSGTFHQIDAGSRFVCGLRTNGNLACWGIAGSFFDGELAPPAARYLQVSVGYNLAAATKLDETVAVWGSRKPIPPPPSGPFRQVGMSQTSHICGYRADGTIVCWNLDNYVPGDDRLIAPAGLFGPTGRIEITQQTNPAGMPDSFGFTSNVAATPTFSLGDGMTRSMEVAVGSYTITQSPAAGYDLSDLTCSKPGAADIANRRAVIAVSEGETVSCAFSNTRLFTGLDKGTVVVRKVVSPAGLPDEFNFVSSSNETPVFSLSDGEEQTMVAPVGAFQVSEVAAADGYPSTDISCEGGAAVTDQAAGQVEITVVKDITVTCTFLTTVFDSAFLTTRTAGRIGDMAYGSADILRWSEGGWTKWFDAAAAGLLPDGLFRNNINAVSIPDPDAAAMVFSLAQNNGIVTGVSGPVSGTDLLLWDGATFSRWFDGSDVGLSTITQEKIDGLHVLNRAPSWSEFSDRYCLSYLLISTQGPGRVPKPGNPWPVNSLKFGGEDVLGFCAESLGAQTRGRWEIVMDGSAVGLARNNIDSIATNAAATVMYFTTQRESMTDGASGNHSTVFALDLATRHFSGPLFRAMDFGVDQRVDGLQIVGSE